MSNTLANQRPLASAVPNNFGPFVLIVLGLLLSLFLGLGFGLSLSFLGFRAGILQYCC